MSDKKRKQTADKRKHNQTPAQPALYERINGFFERHKQTLFYLVMVLSAAMSILLFDVKISLSGDDADYLVESSEFWNHFTYPGGRGILYPVVIAPVIGIFGMNLLLIKSVSALFMLLSIWLFYRSFHNKIPAVILMPALLLVSICSYVFFYASHTYSEPLFMLTQGLFVYFFVKYFITEEENIGTDTIPEKQKEDFLNGQLSYLKANYYKFLVIAATALAMTLTRTIGYGVLGAIILYLSVQRRWKDVVYMLAAAVIVFTTFKLTKSIIWAGTGSEPYAFTNLLAKDHFNPALGMEDFPGIVKRIVDNSHSFLSAFLFQFMGLIPETPSNYFSTNTLRTILIYALFVLSTIVVFNKNKALLFAGLYAGVMTMASFVLLQASWAQDRIIMIYYPFILMFLLGGLCYFLKIKQLRKVFWIYLIAPAAIFVGTAAITKNRVARNLPVLQQNLLGDQLYGWTPDWVNFIKGSQWAAENLEEDARIMSRKPSMSRVYTGREFIGGSAPISPKDVIDTLFRDNRTVFVVDISGHTLGGDPLQHILTAPRPKSFTVGDKQTVAVGIYTVPEGAETNLTVNELTKANIIFSTDYDAFLTQCHELDFRVYTPDVLLQSLINSKVDYILLPQLRADPTRKSEVFINNIHRYLWYISPKYPDRFKLIHTVGQEEPCEIVQFVH